jgi:hypothetical protein
VKIFHFLPEEWALKAIKDKRLKVSKYSDFNDPFELAAMSLENKFERTVILENKRKINKVLRVLCCSGNWKSPLLWAHYGDKHKGIAVELEVPEGAAEAISYRKSREPLNLQELFSNPSEESKRRFYKLCNTKYIEWGYEDEYRVQFTEEDYFADGDHDFYKLGDEIKVTGIILGALNKLTKLEIEKFIPKGQEISVTTTRTAFNSFNIVKRKDRPIYTATGSG